MTEHSSEQSTLHPSLATNIRFIASNGLLGILFALFAYAAFQSWRTTGHVQSLVLAFQEFLIVGLAVTRRPSRAETRAPWDWLVAFVGTAAPLLQRPGLTLPALEPLGIAIQVVGTVLATVAVASLGRSFGIVAANRGVQTNGMYRFVRHPLYGSYMVGYFGFVLGNLSVLNIVLICLTILCQYARTLAEERILLDDAEYQRYAQRVHYRFIPFLF
ncbi:MAG TPA: isoprenylcysteine carboxylmethyltransferase family protein [Roseiflexaceae bacterium]|nr:isoprenylcysteine carboxylmethyltransferase family protein [Roseiflexaceae bacterium]